MIGPIIIVAVIVIFIPVSVMVSGGIFAGILGYFLKHDVDAEFEGSEYLDLS